MSLLARAAAATPVPTLAHARAQRWWVALELVVVLVAAVVVLSSAAQWVQSRPAEGEFMRRSSFFRYLFLERDWTRAEWGDNYDTHTQPMLANYIMGAWLWLNGYDLLKLETYEYSRTLEENRNLGRVPADTTFAFVRTPMVAFSVAAVCLLYLVGRLLGGIAAGLVAAALALGSPLAQQALVTAKGDAPLLFFLLLGLLLCMLGARRGRDGGLPLIWAVGAGVALGLGFQAKLTAVLSLVAVGAWLVLVIAAVLLRASPEPSAARLRSGARAARGWAVVLGVGLGVWVITNPHLYPNPALHTLHMFQDRVQEMQGDQPGQKPRRVPSLPERVRFVLDGSLVDGTATDALGLSIELPLAAAGAAVLLVRTWLGWRRSGSLPVAEGLALLTVLTYFGGISAGLLRPADRYYLPSLMLGTLCSATAVAAALGVLRSSIPK